MLELIATFVLFGSILGMGVILFRKIPVLVGLPKSSRKTHTFSFLELKRKIFLLFPENLFGYEKFLQKLLSRVRVLVLKTDYQTLNWLQTLREKSKKNKSKEDDNYWQEVKNSTKEKK